jgi:hypothetical protein
VARPGGEVSGLAQQQLFGAVLGLLAELAEGHPVLLILRTCTGPTVLPATWSRS